MGFYTMHVYNTRDIFRVCFCYFFCYHLIAVEGKMHSLPVLITDLTLISIYAGIAILLFKWLKQPVVLGYILAGIVAGPYFTLFPSVTDKANITIWAAIGVIFLLFSLGLEFSF